MYTRSAKILLAETNFAILLYSETDLSLMYTRSASFRHTFRYIIAF
jgi:hypothetical protein